MCKRNCKTLLLLKCEIVVPRRTNKGARFRYTSISTPPSPLCLPHVIAHHSPIAHPSRGSHTFCGGAFERKSLETNKTSPSRNDTTENSAAEYLHPHSPNFTEPSIQEYDFIHHDNFIHSSSLNFHVEKRGNQVFWGESGCHSHPEGQSSHGPNPSANSVSDK
jgi:hypothetical protein